jgi:hypothetical protein
LVFDIVATALYQLGTCSLTLSKHSRIGHMQEDILTMVDGLPDQDDTLDTEQLSADAHWMVIPPSSPFLKRWKQVTELVLLWYFIEVPVHIAFRPEEMYAQYPPRPCPGVSISSLHARAVWPCEGRGSRSEV